MVNKEKRTATEVDTRSCIKSTGGSCYTKTRAQVSFLVFVDSLCFFLFSGNVSE